MHSINPESDAARDAARDLRTNLQRARQQRSAEEQSEREKALDAKLAEGRPREFIEGLKRAPSVIVPKPLGILGMNPTARPGETLDGQQGRVNIGTVRGAQPESDDVA